MKTILFTTTALVALGACAPKVQQICIDEYIDKLNPSVQTCSDVAVGWSYWMQPTPDHMDPKDDPDEPKAPDTPEKPDEPTPETPDTDPDPDLPDGPDSPDDSDKPDRVKGNNGWGNGDQPAPGKSGPNNNAENDRGGRSQRNHGASNSN